MIFAVAAMAVLLSMAVVLVRAFAGPSLYDRLLAANVLGTQTVLLIAVLVFLMGRPDFLDLALVYALINFISTIGLLRFFESLSLSPPGASSSADKQGREQ